MSKIKQKFHEIIFEADTFGGKTFDIALLIGILISIITVMLESVESIRLKYGDILNYIEWSFTIVFTLEYFLRIWIINKSYKYIFSFYGLIDLLSVLPTYLSLIFFNSPSLIVLRSLRLLRVFRILKLVQFIGEARVIISALKSSARKIMVFLFAVLTITIIMGSMMYQIEGATNGFTSIPKSMYWAIVTLTTVGYGDIAPQTVIGQTIASVLMIMGYGIIAVPTGIVGAEISKSSSKSTSTQTCPNCSLEGHDDDAIFCKECGSKL